MKIYWFSSIYYAQPSAFFPSQCLFPHTFTLALQSDKTQNFIHSFIQYDCLLFYYFCLSLVHSEHWNSMKFLLCFLIKNKNGIVKFFSCCCYHFLFSTILNILKHRGKAHRKKDRRRARKSYFPVSMALDNAENKNKQIQWIFFFK